MVVINNMEMDIVPVVPGGKEEQKLPTNWATNIVYSTNVLHEVKSVEEIQALLPSLDNVTVVATGHTFNFIADNLHNRISLRLLNGVVDLDTSARTVVVNAGMRYDQLCPYLDSKGFALPNQASLTQVSIAGAISTAAHGSGNRNRNLATAVSALEMVNGDGESVTLSREADGETFRGAVVGLGALGVITRITLDIEPAFRMRQYVYEGLPFGQLEQHFDAIMGSGYTVSLFTDWQDKVFYQMWVKFREEDLAGNETFAAGPPPELFGAKLQTGNVHFYRGEPPINCTEQMGVPGPSFERLPHFRTGLLSDVGEELQSEYLLPRHHAVAAIMALEPFRDQITPLLLETEIRTIAADNLWMSTSYGRDSVAIHFCWIPDWPGVERLLPIIETALAPFDPRPHWGKLFAIPPAQVRSKYEKVDDFVKLAAKYDPKGKFRNEFLNANIFTE